MATRDGVNLALKIIGREGLSGIQIEAGSPSQALASLLAGTTVNNNDFNKIMKELRRQRLIEVLQDGQNIRLTLSPAGAYRLSNTLIRQLKVPSPKSWDQKWRLVTFDIPINRSASRKRFTEHLQSLNFYMLQRSIWIHPFPCFDELAQLAGHYNLLRYCSFLEISMLDSNSTRRLLKHFEPLLRR